MRTVLGVDLGTSGMKAVAVADDGSVLAEVEAGYEVAHPEPGWAEIDPERWVEATVDALRSLVAEIPDLEPVALGIDGQMHGVVLVDETERCVRPAVLWPDRRAESMLPRWRELPGEQRTRLANPIAAGMAGPILDWLVHHEPDAVARAAVALQPKDYVRLQLGGTAVGDRSDASATLLWDVGADDWARDVAAALDLPARLLPPVRPSAAPDGPLHGRGASDVPGPQEVPMVVGAGDTPAALLAAGGLEPGAVQLNLGSGAQVLLGVDRPESKADPVTHLYATADPPSSPSTPPRSPSGVVGAPPASDGGPSRSASAGWGTSRGGRSPSGVEGRSPSGVEGRSPSGVRGGWYAMAAIQNAGLALGRMRRWLGMDWEQFYAAAQQAPPGAGGVSVQPFLTGERGGVAGPQSRGAWLGLSETTTREHIARASVEGVVFTVRRGLDLLRAAPATIRLTGGGGRNPLVAQLLADITGAQIARVPDRSASALGAAMLAGRPCGIEIPPLQPSGPRYEPAPQPALADAYDRWLSGLQPL